MYWLTRFVWQHQGMMEGHTPHTGWKGLLLDPILVFF